MQASHFLHAQRSDRLIAADHRQQKQLGRPRKSIRLRLSEPLTKLTIVIVFVTSLTNARQATFGFHRITLRDFATLCNSLSMGLVMVMAMITAALTGMLRRCDFLRRFRALPRRVRVMVRVEQKMKARTKSR